MIVIPFGGKNTIKRMVFFFAEITQLEQFGRHIELFIPPVEDKLGWFSFFPYSPNQITQQLSTNLSPIMLLFNPKPPLSTLR